MFSSQKVGNHTIRVIDESDVCEYLFIGEKKAALIDTGYGIGDLKGYVETLTDLPYNVYLTHGHVDHASGASQFDDVYINFKDIELVKKHSSVSFRKAFLRQFGVDIPIQAFLPQRKLPFLKLYDGMCIDLGNLSILFIEVSGHTHGTMVPICIEDRIAIFGDACGPGTILSFEESTSIEEYLYSLCKLKRYEQLYDVVLRQHGSFESKKSILDDNIENCKNILSGNDDHVPCDNDYWACEVDAVGKIKNGKEGNIRYSRNSIKISV